MTIEVGHLVICNNLPSSSFYTLVIGRVTEIRNGWATIQATTVQDKWSKSPYQHPSSCATSVQLKHIVRIEEAA